MEFVDDDNLVEEKSELSDPTELLEQRNARRELKNNYAAIKTTSASKIRIENYVSLRKKHKDEQLTKRRFLPEPEEPTLNTSSDSLELPYNHKETIAAHRVEIYRCAKNGNHNALHLALKKLRKHINANFPMYNYVVEAIFSDEEGKFVQQLVAFTFDSQIDDDSLTELLYVLQLLVEGQNVMCTNVLISLNVIHSCILNLITKQNQRITERCLYILGHIAADFETATKFPHPNDSTMMINIRDYMLSIGIVNIIVNIASGRPYGESLRQFYPEKEGDEKLFPCPHPNMKDSTLLAMAYCVSNLTKCNSKKTAPIFEFVAVAAQLMSNLLPDHDDKRLDLKLEEKDNNTKFEIMICALWSLTNMTQFLDVEDTSKIDLILSTRCASKIVALLTYQSTRIILPCLRFCGQICAGTNMHTQTMVSFGLMSNLVAFLTPNTQKDIKKEALWTLSNILSLDTNIERACLTGIFPLLGQIMRHGKTLARVEAIYCVNNVCSAGSDDRVVDLWNCGIHEYLVEALNLEGEIAKQDTGVLKYTIECIGNLIKVGHRHMQLCQLYQQQPEKMQHMLRGLAATSKKLLMMKPEEQESEISLVMKGSVNIVLCKLLEVGNSFETTKCALVDNLVSLSEIPQTSIEAKKTATLAAALLKDWNLNVASE